MLFLAPMTFAAPGVPSAERRAILAVIGRAAFRHPRRHPLTARTLRADARFAYAEVHRRDDEEQADSDREILRFFDPIGDHGGDTEFFLRKASGHWRIMYWMSDLSEGAAEGEGFVFDYRPLRATGFPSALAPNLLRRTWAHKLIYTKRGTESSIVTDVATLDRNREKDRFRLDGYLVENRGLNRP